MEATEGAISRGGDARAGAGCGAAGGGKSPNRESFAIASLQQSSDLKNRTNRPIPVLRLSQPEFAPEQYLNQTNF